MIIEKGAWERPQAPGYRGRRENRNHHKGNPRRFNN
jgi:hypothetical protein